MRRRGVAQLNAVRLGGLACACGNGLYALYVLHRFKDDPAGAPPCAGVALMRGDAARCNECRVCVLLVEEEILGGRRGCGPFYTIDQ